MDNLQLSKPDKLSPRAGFKGEFSIYKNNKILFSIKNYINNLFKSRKYETTIYFILKMLSTCFIIYI